MMKNHQPNLTFQEISFTRDGREILNSVSGNFFPGELTALMGLNGVGKTTLLKILSGTLRVKKGRVFLYQKDLMTFSPPERAIELAFVPQDFPTDFPFTIREFIGMGNYARTTLKKNRKNEFEFLKSTLEFLNFDLHLDRLVNTLSGGERQKVLLARALYQDTRVILLDEPFNHLDLRSRSEYIQIFKKLACEQGRTILAILHDPYAVRDHFDQVVFLKQGQITYHGQVDQAFIQSRIQDVFGIDKI